MKQSKTLVIPDIHNKVEWADIWIDEIKPNKIIFLGDYFDSIGDNVADAQRTAYWLRNSIEQENRVHLWGNHDIPYYKTNEHTICPGWKDTKFKAINEILTPDHWKKIKFIHKEEKWYLSHAGITNKTFRACLDSNIENIWDHQDECYECLEKNQKHWFLNGSFARMLSRDPFPGLLWCDWQEEFSPISKINQIVGHSCYPSVRFEQAYPYENDSGDNYCIDTSLHGVLIIDGDKWQLPFRTEFSVAPQCHS